MIANSLIKYKIKKSKIAGKGCFSTEDVKKGKILGVGFRKIGDSGKEDKDYERTTLGEYINHAKKPNTKLEKKRNIYLIKSKKNIKAGDELTLDYKTFPWEGERDFAK